MRTNLQMFCIAIFLLVSVGMAQCAPVYNSATGHWYDIVSSDPDGSWLSSETNANAHGGHLVTINDATEEAWLRATFGGETRYWIGFTDVSEEGTWIWLSSELVTYTNWDTGEPSNHTPPAVGEDFAVLNWNIATGGWNDWDHERPDYSQIDGIAEFDVFIVDIDIKPGSFPNPINHKSKGVIPVAILTTSISDATTVKFFGHCSGASMAHEDAHLEDVDNDGDIDMVLHFRTQETHISTSDTEARIEGETLYGLTFIGTDSILIVP